MAKFVEGASSDDFGPDSLLRRAIERTLEIVGEAARRTSPELRARYQDIPWRDIIGQRNVLAHDYGEINAVRLWDTATTKMVPLIEVIDRIIPAEEVGPEESR